MNLCIHGKPLHRLDLCPPCEALHEAFFPRNDAPVRSDVSRTDDEPLSVPVGPDAAR